MKACTSRAARIASVVAVILALTNVAAAQERSGNLHYLAIGISDYAGRGNLRYARKDAIDLAAEWRSQQGKLYQLVEGETLLDREATRDNFLAALERLRERVRAGDVVAISLAGHGGTNSQDRYDGDWYFIPYGMHSGDLRSSAISSSILRARIAELTERGATVILILDSCHSAAFGGMNGRVMVLASCLTNETCCDHWSVENGLFTRALIDALNGAADVNHDGVVTLEAAYAYVNNRVAQFALKIKVPMVSQHAWFNWSSAIQPNVPLSRPMGSPMTPANPNAGR